MKKSLLLLSALMVGILTNTAALHAQQQLSLEDCRRMALAENTDLKQARTRIEMAGYDRKIALANYFPNISATGTYMRNGKNISLLTDDMSAKLQGLGPAVGSKMSATMQGIQ